MNGRSAESFSHQGGADPHDLLDRFEQSWQAGAAPGIADFLASLATAPAQVRRRLLAELVTIDIEYRWRSAPPAGSNPQGMSNRPRLEDYLARFPELGCPDEILCEVIGAEYRVRQRWGDGPGHAEYAARFPQLAAMLQQRLDRIDRDQAGEGMMRPGHGTAAAGTGAWLRGFAPQDSVQAIASSTGLLEILGQQPFLRPDQLAEVAGTLQYRFPEARALARELLQRNWLTPYQANQLVQGRGHELLLGPYLVLARLGEGGAGQVFKARHQKLDRMVALKVIRKELLADAEVVGRFYREIQVLSQLDHPNVVHAYDAGPAGPTHFLAMEYVEGIDLGKLVKQGGPMPVMQACAYVGQAALGLQHAHERGLVHRDIKPHNLIMSVRDGLIKVADLGLARLLRGMNAEVTAVLSGVRGTGTLTPENAVLMGTADYLAPEQAMDFHQADIRADIYSLGCAFYYVLTGQAPFAGGGLAQKVTRHLHAAPPALEQFRQDLPAGLSGVLGKMLAKRPEERYQTPADLAAALHDISGAASVAVPAKARADVSVPAVPDTQRRRSSPALHLLKKSWHRLGIKGSGAVLTLLALMVALAAWGWRRGADPSRPPGGEGASAEDRLLAGNLPGLVAVIGDQRLRHWAAVRCLAFSPSNELLVSAGEDRAIRVWHAATGKPVQLIPTTEAVARLWVVAAGTRLAAATGGGLKMWDLSSGADVTSAVVPGPPAHFLGFSPDGNTFATVGNGNQINLWHAATGRKQGTFRDHAERAQCIAFSSNSQLAASAANQTILIWETTTGKQRQSLTGYATSLQLTPRGELLASVDGATGKLWDVVVQKELASFANQNPAWYSFSPDGKALAVWNEGAGTEKLWDMSTRKERISLSHNPHVLLFSPQSDLVAAGRSDHGDVKVWDVASGLERLSLKASGGIAALSFALDGKTLVTGSIRGDIEFWDMATGNQRQAGANRPEWYSNAIFSKDGKTLALTGKAGLKLWDWATGTEKTALPDDWGESFREAVFAADGQTLATWRRGASPVYLWQVARGPLRRKLDHGGPVAFAADGKTLATAGGSAVKLWDAQTGEPQAATLPGVSAGVSAVAFAPAGDRTLAWGGYDGTVRLWDLSTGKERALFRMSKEGMVEVRYTPNGRVLCAKGAEGIKLWELAKNTEMVTLPAGPVWSLSPDSHTIAIGLDKGAVQVFDVATGKPQVLPGHTKAVSALAYAADGRLVSAGLDGKVIVWSSAFEKKPLHEWQLPGQVRQVDFAADGRHLATVNANGTVYILRVPSAKGE